MSSIIKLTCKFIRSKTAHYLFNHSPTIQKIIKYWNKLTHEIKCFEIQLRRQLLQFGVCSENIDRIQCTSIVCFHLHLKHISACSHKLTALLQNLCSIILSWSMKIWHSFLSSVSQMDKSFWYGNISDNPRMKQNTSLHHPNLHLRRVFGSNSLLSAVSFVSFYELRIKLFWWNNVSSKSFLTLFNKRCIIWQDILKIFERLLKVRCFCTFPARWSLHFCAGSIELTKPDKIVQKIQSYLSFYKNNLYTVLADFVYT